MCIICYLSVGLRRQFVFQDDDWSRQLLMTWWHIFRVDSRFSPSQSERPLLCNSVSHWLGASLESALIFIVMIFNRNKNADISLQENVFKLLYAGSLPSFLGPIGDESVEMFEVISYILSSNEAHSLLKNSAVWKEFCPLVAWGPSQ